jgi:hypothetical protein
MSVQGKGNLSYKKQNVQKQNAPHTGVKNITFAHLFSNAGETTIPFDALVTPPEWSTSGLVNPTSQSLLSAQLQVFKNNVTVTSSARGLIQKSEYIVHGNRIEFKNITSLVNEYFEVEVADILITGNLIVDMQTIRVEGELQDTETDFNMGYEFDVLNEEIIVFRDGIQMFRSDNNDSSGTTGNYYYVDTDGDGRSSLLRFFEPSVGVEPVLIASTGGVVDNANVSTFQQIEHLAGQLDAIVPTVAALAGVPESNFRANPNNVDLKTFGDKVIQLQKILDLEVELPKKYSELHYDQIGSTLLSVNSIKFNTSLFVAGGNANLITMDNTGGFTKFISSKKSKVTVTCRAVIDDGTNTASMFIGYQDETRTITSSKIPVSGSVNTLSFTFIQDAGKYFRLYLPLGVVNTSSSVIVNIVAESLEEKDVILNLI